MLLLIALLALSPVPAASRQMVLCLSPGWETAHGRLGLYERTSAQAPWRAVGEGFDVSLGRNGLAWGRGLHGAALEGPIKKEGDGKSPAGVFDLRLATGYAPQPPPQTKLRYRQATETLRCVDDSASGHYNQLVDERSVRKDWSSDEAMRRPDDLYRLLVWVGHNDQPVAKDAGSCIFLHLRDAPTAVTAGCTAFEPDRMERLLGWLDPAARPVLVQLPTSVMTAVGRAWDLPSAEP